MFNRILSLQSINQPQLCEQMLEAMTRDDRDSLLMVTSTQRISMSSKLLQIFSPLYRDILRDIPSKDIDPVTLIIPDTEADHVQHLLDLLTSGKIQETARGSSRDIVTLAECFKIRLKESDLSDIDQKLQPRIKVKKLGDMSSLVPSTIERTETDKCSFCSKAFRGGRKSVRKHEETECKNRPNAPVCSLCLKKIVGGRRSFKNHKAMCRLYNECSFCYKKIDGGRKSFENHRKVCDKVFKS